MASAGEVSVIVARSRMVSGTAWAVIRRCSSSGVMPLPSALATSAVTLRLRISTAYDLARSCEDSTAWYAAAALPSSGADTISVIDAAYCVLMRIVTRAVTISARSTDVARRTHRRRRSRR
jgi:hypothetical protein